MASVATLIVCDGVKTLAKMTLPGCWVCTRCGNRVQLLEAIEVNQEEKSA